MANLTINDQLRQLYADGQPRTCRHANQELGNRYTTHQISRGISLLRKQGYLALDSLVDSDGLARYKLAENLAPENTAHVYSTPRRQQDQDPLLGFFKQQADAAKAALDAYLQTLGDQTLTDLLKVNDAANTAYENRRSRPC